MIDKGTLAIIGLIGVFWFIGSMIGFFILDFWFPNPIHIDFCESMGLTYARTSAIGFFPIIRFGENVTCYREYKSCRDNICITMKEKITFEYPNREGIID